MEHLEELKEFAALHARGQGIPAAHTTRVLDRIVNDTPGDPRSWAAEWMSAGAAAAEDGNLLDACRHYALARFPYPADDDRRRAQRLCVDTFDAWRRSRGGIERLEFSHPEGDFGCWATGLDGPRRRPLIIVMGGIVSVKEQWAPLLPLLRRLGFAAIATELPGVGENTLRYRPDSWQLLPFLLDRLADRADVHDTSMLALSFGGHLALRAAVDDRRIRRIMTVGAPVSDFFTDSRWWPGVPEITADTLLRLTGESDRDALRALLPEFALTPAQLTALRTPVRYVASSRDEIIPAAEYPLLRRATGDVRIRTFDDVHGSPAHLGATRRWLLSSLLRLRWADRRRRRTGPTAAAEHGLPVPNGSHD